MSSPVHVLLAQVAAEHDKLVAELRQQIVNLMHQVDKARDVPNGVAGFQRHVTDPGRVSSKHPSITSPGGWQRMQSDPNCNSRQSLGMGSDHNSNSRRPSRLLETRSSHGFSIVMDSPRGSIGVDPSKRNSNQLTGLTESTQQDSTQASTLPDESHSNWNSDATVKIAVVDDSNSNESRSKASDSPSSPSRSPGSCKQYLGVVPSKFETEMAMDIPGSCPQSPPQNGEGDISPGRLSQGERLSSAVPTPSGSILSLGSLKARVSVAGSNGMSPTTRAHRHSFLSTFTQVGSLMKGKKNVLFSPTPDPGPAAMSLRRQSQAQFGQEDTLDQGPDIPAETAQPLTLTLNPAWDSSFEEEEISATQSMAGAIPRSRFSSGALKFKSRHTELHLLEAQIGCGKFVAHPSSRRRFIWEILGFLFLLYDLVMVPMQVYSPEDSDVLKICQWCTTIFWTMDIVASFMVGHYKHGYVEVRLSKIAAKYIKSWFIPDFTIVLLDWTFTIISSSFPSLKSLSKISRGLRGLRLLRIMKFQMLLTEMIQRVHSEYKQTMIGIAKIVLFIMIVNHFIACGFYGLHFLRDDPPDKSWVTYFFDSTDGTMYRYWTSMHWSLTQFTPASMEVTPRNSTERFYTVVVMFVALITFSSFISSITNAMTRLRNINQAHIEREAVLHRFLDEHNISRKVVHRVMNLINERKQDRSVGVLTKEEDVDLFRTLPESLKSEVRYEAYMPVISAHPFFAAYHDCDAGSVKGICRTSLHERTLIVREELFGAGAPLTHMVFIRTGCLQFNPPENIMLAQAPVLENGSWMCEVCLWANNPETSGPFMASGLSDVVMLNASSFIARVKKFPWSRRMVATYAKLFMEAMITIAVDYPGDVMLCHETESLQELANEAFGGDDDEDEKEHPDGVHARRSSFKSVLAHLAHLSPSDTARGSWHSRSSKTSSARKVKGHGGARRHEDEGHERIGSKGSNRSHVSHDSYGSAGSHGSKHS